MQKGLTSVEMIKMTNRKIRIGYAISVFAISLALLFVSAFFFTSNPLIYFLLNNITDIFIASMIFTEILLLSIFVFFITNPEFTKARKLEIIAVFIFLMILDYLISAYLYTQPFICTHFLFFGTNHFHIDTAFTSLSTSNGIFHFEYVTNTGNYNSTKIYLHLYILNMPPFTTTIPNLKGETLYVKFNVHSPTNISQVLYTITIPYKIVEENISRTPNLYTNVLSLIYSNKFYVLTLEPLKSNQTIYQIGLNKTLELQRTLQFAEIKSFNQTFTCENN